MTYKVGDFVDRWWQTHLNKARTLGALLL